MSDTADHIGFLVFAFIAAVIVLVLLLVAAQWLLNKGFGPGNVAGPSTSGIFRPEPMEHGHFYLLARHSADLRRRIEFESSNLQDVKDKRDNYHEHDAANIELKIVSVHDDHFATINSIAAELNKEL